MEEYITELEEILVNFSLLGFSEKTRGRAQGADPHSPFLYA
jgi:hypothetical protein